MAIRSTISSQILRSIRQDIIPIRYTGWWSEVTMGSLDPIFGVQEAYAKDKNPKKVNVGIGAYRNDDGKPHVLKCVRAAEEKIRAKKMNKEYQPIIGQSEFRKVAIELALGKDSPVIQNKLVAVAQCKKQKALNQRKYQDASDIILAIGGTGALRVGGRYLSKFHKHSKSIFVPTPTWSAHTPLFEAAGLKIERYVYYDLKTRGFNFKGCLDSINKIPEKSVILFHAVAHNPTGVDPNHEQWKEISSVVKKKNLLPFFDIAYQGFASGDIIKDAFSLRHFIKDGHQVIIAQSFSKNMGLYGERVGNVMITCDSKETATKVLSQMKIIIRRMYSNPPCNGSRIVTEILSDEALYKQWLIDLKEMADRIIAARKKLREHLENVEKSSYKWDHITNQIGMFCYTGMNPDQVHKITKNSSVFLTKDGRISMAGVSSKNVAYLAHAMHTAMN